MASYAFDEPRWSESIADTRLESLVLAVAALNPPAAGLEVVERVRALVADPVYQLK